MGEPIATLYDNGAIPPFNEKEAQLLAEKLSIEESHKEAQQVLIAWLERGLKNEEKECLEKFEEAKKNLSNQKYLLMFDQKKIEHAFKAIQKQDVWESFSLIQRRNIHVFKKYFSHLVQSTNMNCTNNAVEEESISFKKDAYKLEKANLTRTIYSLTSALKEMNREAKDIETGYNKCENEIKRLKLELKKQEMSRKQENAEVAFAYNADYACQKELHIMCTISFLLFQHPPGLNFDAIYSHLNMTFPNVSREEIEFVLRKFSRLFEEIGLEPEKKWIYIGIRI